MIQWVKLHMLAQLGCGAQLFGQMLIPLLQETYSIDVIDIYNKLIINKSDCPLKCRWASSIHLKYLGKRFPMEQGILPQEDNNETYLSFQPASLPYGFIHIPAASPLDCFQLAGLLDLPEPQLSKPIPQSQLFSLTFTQFLNSFFQCFVVFLISNEKKAICSIIKHNKTKVFGIIFTSESDKNYG